MNVARLALVEIALAPLAVRADWWQFRGPDGSGLAPGGHGPAEVRSAAGEGGWQAELPGRGLSSPIVVGKLSEVSHNQGVDPARFAAPAVK